MPVTVRRLLKPLLIAVTAYGTAGCVTQLPWELPDPYSSRSGGGSAYYGSSPYYYGGGYGYGSQYYGRGYYGDPYYYYRRGGAGLPYPAYGYAPHYPGHTCWDNNRDGRCDSRPGAGDHPGGGGDVGNGRPDSDHPLRDVRRAIRERERGARSPGAAPNAATLGTVPHAAGEAPKVRVPARTQAPSSPPPRVESRRPSEPAAAMRRGPRADEAPREPRAVRDDAGSGRRPLR